MARKEADTLIPLEKRREIYLAVAEAQDSGQSIEQSRKATAEKFAITPAQVKAIETEGVDNQWPPFDDPA